MLPTFRATNVETNATWTIRADSLNAAIDQTLCDLWHPTARVRVERQTLPDGSEQAMLTGAGVTVYVA